MAVQEPQTFVVFRVGKYNFFISGLVRKALETLKLCPVQGL
jgi:hypothetical protein